GPGRRRRAGAGQRVARRERDTGDEGAGRRPGRAARRRPPAGRRLPGPRLAPGMIRVLLADDQALVRAGFRALLDAEPDVEVVGEAGDGAEAARLARSTRPDVVLMDIRMPGVDGLEATRRIVADPDLAQTRILILTTFDLDE